MLERWVSEHGTLIAAAAAQPGSRRLRGRGEVVLVPRGPVDGEAGWVVRHYHRGGAVARALGDRYPRIGAPRPFRELAVLEALRARSIPTSPPVGAAVYPSALCYRGDLVTEWVTGSSDLGRVLFGAEQLDSPAGGPIRGEPGDAMEAAGRLVRRLHDEGVSHPDLNLKNILIVDGATGAHAAVIDLDRAVLRDRLTDRARRRMLKRFGRSLRKWEKRTARAAPAGAREAFERGYGAPFPRSW